MSVKIQKPSKGRVVLFTAHDMTEHIALITEPAPLFNHEIIPGRVNLVTFLDGGGDDDGDTCFEIGIHHSLTPKAGTWRYPPPVREEIEVSE